MIIKIIVEQQTIRERSLTLRFPITIYVALLVFIDEQLFVLNKFLKKKRNKKNNTVDAQKWLQIYQQTHLIYNYYQHHQSMQSLFILFFITHVQILVKK